MTNNHAFIEAQPTRRWSWTTYAAGVATGVIVGAAGFFGLGALLFEDDIQADLQTESTDSFAVDYAQDYAAQLTTCEAHSRSCHEYNDNLVNAINNALDNPPPGLKYALISFSTEYASFVNQRCGVNKSNVMCGLAGMNMNLAVATIKAEAANL